MTRVVSALLAVPWFDRGRDEMLVAALDASIDGHSLWAPVFGENDQLVDLTCVYSNPAGGIFVGRTVGEIVGSSLLAGARTAGNDEFAYAMLEVARTKVALRRRLQLATRSGGHVWVDLVAVHLAGGLSISGRDVTAEVTLQAELKKAVAESARLASVDHLTGLANRRVWSQALTRLLTQAAVTDCPLVVALLDFDRFKAYNDQNGHPAGDDLLREAAIRWKQHIPATATLARLGGEEFGVALPNTTPEAGRKLLLKLCALMPAGQTSSAGLTVWDGTEDERSLLGPADAALYAAKHAATV